jgi:hypothetical protein
MRAGARHIALLDPPAARHCRWQLSSAHARRKREEVAIAVGFCDDAPAVTQALSGLTPTVRHSATPAPASATHPILGFGSSRPCQCTACIGRSVAAYRSTHQHPIG